MQSITNGHHLVLVARQAFATVLVDGTYMCGLYHLESLIIKRTLNKTPKELFSRQKPSIVDLWVFWFNGLHSSKQTKP
jgi:hypothetical protein